MCSTYDMRYPTVYPVRVGCALPGLDEHDRREAVRVGSAIAMRTGTSCFYNSVSGKLMWVYGDEPHGGPLGVPFRRGSGVRKYEAHEIDNMVLYVQMGKLSRREKDRIEAGNAKNESHDRNEAQQRSFEDRRPDAKSYAAFLDRKRRGVGRVSVPVGAST